MQAEQPRSPHRRIRFLHPPHRSVGCRGHTIKFGAGTIIPHHSAGNARETKSGGKLRRSPLQQAEWSCRITVVPSGKRASPRRPVPVLIIVDAVHLRFGATGWRSSKASIIFSQLRLHAIVDHAYVPVSCDGTPYLAWPVEGSWRLSDKRFCFLPASRVNGMRRGKFGYGEQPGVLLGVGLSASFVDIGNRGANHIRKRRITMPADINA
jgi:hypothetical protein